MSIVFKLRTIFRGFKFDRLSWRCVSTKLVLPSYKRKIEGRGVEVREWNETGGVEEKGRERSEEGGREGGNGREGKGGHLSFTFHWPVSIPDMEIEFTVADQSIILVAIANRKLNYIIYNRWSQGFSRHLTGSAKPRRYITGNLAKRRPEFNDSQLVRVNESCIFRWQPLSDWISCTRTWSLCIWTLHGITSVILLYFVKRSHVDKLCFHK